MTEKSKKILNLVFDEGASQGEILNGINFLRKEYKEGKLFTNENYHEAFEKLYDCEKMLQELYTKDNSIKNLKYKLEDLEYKNTILKINIEDNENTIKTLKEDINYKNTLLDEKYNIIYTKSNGLKKVYLFLSSLAFFNIVFILIVFMSLIK